MIDITSLHIFRLVIKLGFTWTNNGLNLNNIINSNIFGMGLVPFLQQIGENAFRLDLPSHLGVHDVVNVNQLKLYDPPHLEDEFVISHTKDTIPNFQPLLEEDTFLDVCTGNTWDESTTTYQVGCKGSLPTQAKWMS